jgi:3-hydroxyisobutyrate dehydrogenase
MATIAFMGLGKMGSGMAARLLAAGHTLTVYNRTAAKAKQLIHSGARTAATPREACVGADAVIAMTSDDQSSRAIWLGQDGVRTSKISQLRVPCSPQSRSASFTSARSARARHTN